MDEWLCLELGINHRKVLLQVMDWWLHFICAGSGELLDDIVRHGCHDVYWSYSFERQVATYMGISTNQKLNEVSYINFFVRCSFTLAYSCLQEDHDGLLPHQRALKDLHTHLQCSRDYYRPPIRNPLECDEWHVLLCNSSTIKRYGYEILKVTVKSKPLWVLKNDWRKRDSCWSQMPHSQKKWV